MHEGYIFKNIFYILVLAISVPHTIKLHILYIPFLCYNFSLYNMLYSNMFSLFTDKSPFSFMMNYIMNGEFYNKSTQHTTTLPSNSICTNNSGVQRFTPRKSDTVNSIVSPNTQQIFTKIGKEIHKNRHKIIIPILFSVALYSTPYLILGMSHYLVTAYNSDNSDEIEDCINLILSHIFTCLMMVSYSSKLYKSVLLMLTDIPKMNDEKSKFGNAAQVSHYLITSNLLINFSVSVLKRSCIPFNALCLDIGRIIYVAVHDSVYKVIIAKMEQGKEFLRQRKTVTSLVYNSSSGTNMASAACSNGQCSMPAVIDNSSSLYASDVLVPAQRMAVLDSSSEIDACRENSTAVDSTFTGINPGEWVGYITLPNSVLAIEGVAALVYSANTVNIHAQSDQ